MLLDDSSLMFNLLEPQPVPTPQGSPLRPPGQPQAPFQPGYVRTVVTRIGPGIKEKDGVVEL